MPSIESLLKTFLGSFVGRFIIGGLTVGGIAFFSNNLKWAALAGVIAAMPIGMPSSIFVDDAEVVDYGYHLLIMSTILLLSTFTNWYFVSQLKYSKYKSVGISLAIFWVTGIIYALYIGGD